MKTKQLRNFFGTLFLVSASYSVQAAEPSAAMGGALYNQSGANSCVYCHGVGGVGGKIAQAANLQKVKAWRTYKGLGGDEAFKKNKAEFLKNMEEAVVNLILKGAISHNASFKKPYFDWKKAGGTYNAQMLGLAGAPSAAWFKRIQAEKAKDLTKEVAAKSAYLFVKTLDTDGVFK